MRDRGVDTLVSALTGADQVELDLVGEPALAAAAGLSYRSFPIRDFGVPPRDALAELAAALAGELRGGRFVMVHCRGGVGRSGLIACATLIALGAGADEAMTVVSRARGHDVPETEPQRRMLRELSSGGRIDPSANLIFNHAAQVEDQARTRAR